MRVRRKAQRKTFISAATIDADVLVEQLGNSCSVVNRPVQNFHEHYFDTFDWRLFRKDYLFKRRGRTFYLCSKDEHILLKEPGFSKKSFFAGDLVTPGEINTVVEEITGVRALVGVLSLRILRKGFDLRNSDGKTVVRLFLDDITAAGNDGEKSIPTVLHLEDVKGYDKQFEKFSDILESAGLASTTVDGSVFQLALEALTIRPLEYASKFSIVLDRTATVEQSTSKICLCLVNEMETHYHGVIGDIDTEFLHDFRIAIRRTRSLLSQMKKFLPEKENGYFQSEFRWLGSITGPVRDLDVYLLMKKQYTEILPQQLHEGLDGFFADLAVVRQEKLLDLKKGLKSRRYHTLIKDWKVFLEEGPSGAEWVSRNDCCFAIAVNMIRKRFQKILKAGAKINETSPDESLHRLRIQGKKLRYLLEFFRSFFNAEEVDYFLKQLKKLQNNLGDYNDISVQQKMLTTYQKSLVGSCGRIIGIAASIGGLVAYLAGQQREIREQFAMTFDGFATEDNIAKFEMLLL